MKFDSIIKKKKETKLLNKHLKKLAKEFKEEIKEKESKGYKISTPTRNSLFNLVHSIESMDAYNIVNKEKYRFLNTIPDEYEIRNKINEELYRSMINIISDKVNDKNNTFIFNGDNNDFDIFECLSYIESISERHLYNLDFVFNNLIKIIIKSNNKLKIKTALNLLFVINEIGNKDLENKLIDILKSTEDLNKIHLLYILSTRVPFNKDDLINNYVDKILDYILIENNEEYNKNLNEIIIKIFNSKVINKIKYDVSIIDYILKINLENSNNKNMEVILNLLDSDIITTSYTDSLKFMINNTLKINFINEEHKKVYIKILNNIVFKSDNTQIRDYFINKLSETSSIKSMKALLDLYPFIKEYCEGAEKQIFDQLYDIENNINKQFKSDILKKKLIIPVNYKTEE